MKADFDYTPKNPVVGEKITFNNLSQDEASVSWDIAGNAVGDIDNPTYIPNVEGDFNVTLKAVSSTGASDSLIKTITVTLSETPINDIGGIECFAYRDVYTVVSKIGGLLGEKPKEDELTAGYVAIFLDVDKAQILLDKAKAEGRSFFTVFTPTLEENKYNSLYREEND
jgi:PKD repeat protein